MIDCKDLDRAGLERFAESLDQPAFRGRQIMAWLYRPGIRSFSEMTDLARSFRELLPQVATISRFSAPHIQRSADGTVKFAFSLADGTVIESVLIPEIDRNTLCISSQVGCAMGCSFCRTAGMGFIRNLRPAEIVNQVCFVRDFLTEEAETHSLIGPPKITNLVFMGMGEPLNNLKHVLTSIAILSDQKGLDMASRRITVSTCGIVPMMRELGEKTNVNLAVSLHAVDDETRSRLMPINQRYPITMLLDACRTYPMRKRKRIMIEYLMLSGVNDSDRDAHRLVRLLHNIPCKVNLLAFNPCEEIPFLPSPEQRILAFQDILRAAHFSVFIRNSRGNDISAACGQLASTVGQESM